MKNLVYLVSGILFGVGLALSGMIDPAKVKGFLSVGTAQWNPALIFVLGSAVPIYLAVFFFVRRRERTLNGATFAHPKSRPADRRLAIGSLIFGAGWGVAGICPGPALVHLAFLEVPFLVFLVAMFAGFEAQRRWA